MYTSKQAAQENCLKLVRELVSTYQTFTTFSTAHIRTLGLTTPQFDVIATLGNTSGMTFKELGDKTLITKGTLTGVIDRLESKGLVKRSIGIADRRTFQVVLTSKGEALFEQVFPEHILHLKTLFEQLSESEHQQIIQSLHTIKRLFNT